MAAPQSDCAIFTSFKKKKKGLNCLKVLPPFFCFYLHILQQAVQQTLLIWHQIKDPLFFISISFVIFCLINSNKIIGVGHSCSLCMLITPLHFLVSANILSKYTSSGILEIACWGFQNNIVEMNWIGRLTAWLNGYCLLITLRSRNPERCFFFFPSPPSSFSSSSPLLASTDFSDSVSESGCLPKSGSSPLTCSECRTEDPASAYALVL